MICFLFKFLSISVQNLDINFNIILMRYNLDA